MNRTLTLKRGKERVVANKHPWIFAGAVQTERGPEEAPIGDLVDGEGKRIASGFYSRSSQIRLRALTFGDEPVTPELIASRLSAAIARRRPIFDETTNAARLVHAEGDDLSSIVIDRFDDVVVVEIANRGAEQFKPLVIDVLQRELSPRAIFFKNDIPARKLEGLPTSDQVVESTSDQVVESTSRPDDGEGSSTTRRLDDLQARIRREDDEGSSTTRRLDDLKARILESGLKFHVDPAEGQKTGFFLDQRENRRLARTLAGGRRVLNLFSYSGAFGVYAAAGGATSFTNVDISARAIDTARENAALNGFEGEHLVADAFQYVRTRHEPFDLLVCDPPAFAKSRNEVERAARGYKDVNLFAMRLVSPGGLMMTFSCSGHMSLDLFQKVIFAAALDAGRRVSIVRRLTAGPDHPVSLYCPEGEYLKGFLLEIH
ncbi:MAG TPA: class I SAM-dependent rRNA methyltransferase [Thermoanaerobaculia bacterium]